MERAGSCFDGNRRRELLLEGNWQLLLGAQETGGALEGERVPWTPVLSV